MQFRDEDEVIIDIYQVYKYTHFEMLKMALLILSIGAAGFSLIEFSDDVGYLSVFDFSGLVMVGLAGLIFVLAIVKPTLFKITTIEYTKISLTNEREYKEFIDLK